MKKQIFFNLATVSGLLFSAATSFSTIASTDTTFTVEGYCTLKKEKVSTNYLKAYARKLGFKPHRRVCHKISKVVEEFQPKSWDYKAGRLYPGSVIRLSPNQIKKIKEARKLQQQQSAE